MSTVHLPSQLRDLAEVDSPVAVDGTTVRDVLSDLERRFPKTTGWVRDERGALRPHVKVFVNGDVARLEDPVRDADEIRILPAISGGDDGVELLIGTRKGLFVLRGPRGDELAVSGRAFKGLDVEYAIRDPRTGVYLASVTNSHFGPRIFVSDDPVEGWEPSEGPAFPEDADASVERVWTIEPAEEDGVIYAGVAPAALFRSEDRGRSWELNRALWDVPGRASWQPGGGGLCLHSICPWTGDPDRLAIGISAAGVWLSEDRGKSWRSGVKGLVPGYIPEEARENAVDLCVHDIKRCPGLPERIYMQFHGGVYRSDDAGKSWQDVGTDTGLPSDFGFPLVIDPNNSERAYVIPLVADMDRVTPEGRVRVFETRDSGSSWSGIGEGLPQENAYLTVLRQAFCGDAGDPLGLYFGATSGDVFGSFDGGSTWRTLAAHLPPVLSVRSA